MYVRFLPSLWNGKDPLLERGIDTGHEAVLMWSDRVSPMFAGSAHAGGRRFASVHANVHHLLSLERHLPTDRPTRDNASPRWRRGRRSPAKAASSKFAPHRIRAILVWFGT